MPTSTRVHTFLSTLAMQCTMKSPHPTEKFTSLVDDELIGLQWDPNSGKWAATTVNQTTLAGTYSLHTDAPLACMALHDHHRS